MVVINLKIVVELECRSCETKDDDVRGLFFNDRLTKRRNEEG